MGDATIIAWTNATFNIAWGCVKVSPGCAHCYAETGSSRYGHSVWGPDADRRTFGEAHWKEPLKWNRQAQEAKKRMRVFCSSMCDIFEDHPTIERERAKLWPLIRQTPWLDWQLLTKRIERVADLLPDDWKDGYPNVWMGTSVENQHFADLRIPILLKISAAVRFISYEPALAPIHIEKYLGHPNGWKDCKSAWCDHKFLDWVICGGESGRGFRPMDPQWARDVRDQCEAAAVPFFFKQSSAPRTEMGIKLDNRIIREYPEPRSTHGGPKTLF